MEIILFGPIVPIVAIYKRRIDNVVISALQKKHSCNMWLCSVYLCLDDYDLIN